MRDNDDDANSTWPPEEMRCVRGPLDKFIDVRVRPSAARVVSCLPLLKSKKEPQGLKH